MMESVLSEILKIRIEKEGCFTGAKGTENALMFEAGVLKGLDMAITVIAQQLSRRMQNG